MSSSQSSNNSIISNIPIITNNPKKPKKRRKINNTQRSVYEENILLKKILDEEFSKNIPDYSMNGSVYECDFCKTIGWCNSLNDYGDQCHVKKCNKHICSTCVDIYYGFSCKSDECENNRSYEDNPIVFCYNHLIKFYPNDKIPAKYLMPHNNPPYHEPLCLECMNDYGLTKIIKHLK